MKKRMVRITGCLLAGALSIGSFGLNMQLRSQAFQV